MNRPARWAILPQIIPRELLLSAVTWNTSTWQVAAMVGPALGGLVIALSGGASACYVLNAACSCLVIALTATFRLRSVVQDSRPVSWQSLLAGLRFVLRTELILATITLDMFAVFLGGATALLPIFARDILRTGPTGLGWLRAAPSIGSFLMAIVLAHRPPMRRAGRSLLWSVAGFGIATVVFGLSTDPVPFVRHALPLRAPSTTSAWSCARRSSRSSRPTRCGGASRPSTPSSSRRPTSWASSSRASPLASSAPSRPWPSGGVGTLLVVLGVASVWPGLVKLGSLHDVKPAEA